MENIHKQTLRVVFKKYENNYTDFLADRDEISIHQKHLQFLATEVFKSTSKSNPVFFENHEIPHNLRCGNVVKLPGTNTRKYGIDSLNLRDAILWNTITKNIKIPKTLPEFKRKLKKHLIRTDVIK